MICCCAGAELFRAVWDWEQARLVMVLSASGLVVWSRPLLSPIAPADSTYTYRRGGALRPYFSIADTSTLPATNSLKAEVLPLRPVTRRVFEYSRRLRVARPPHRLHRHCYSLMAESENISRSNDPNCWLPPAFAFGQLNTSQHTITTRPHRI